MESTTYVNNDISAESHRWSQKERAHKLWTFRDCRKIGMTEREASEMAQIPRSTGQRWKKHLDDAVENEKMHDWYSESPAGNEMMNDLFVLLTLNFMEKGFTGARSLSNVLKETRLSRYVGSCKTVIAKFVLELQASIIDYGEEEKSRLADGAEDKKITLTLFRQKFLKILKPSKNGYPGPALYAQRAKVPKFFV
jgi:hypothetical protein